MGTKSEKLIEKKELKEYEKDQLEILQKYMKDKNDLKDIFVEDPKKLYELIEVAENSATGIEYSLSWKKLKTFALASYYNSKELTEYYKYMHEKGCEYNKRINGEEEQQNQTIREVDNMLNVYELRLLMEKYVNYKHKDDMYNYLLLASLCLDQEPLRPQIYSSVKYINVLKDLQDENSIYISKKESIGFFYVEHDKVTKHDNKKEMRRIQLSPEYLKIVKKSFIEYPRKYLFEFSTEHTNQKLLDMLQNITKNKFNFQMARSVYITFKYLETPNMSYIQKKALAERMRHSKDTQEKNYLKHHLTKIENTLDELKKEVIDKYNVVKNLEKDLNENVSKIDELKKNTGIFRKKNFLIDNNKDEKTQYILLLQEIKAHKNYYTECIEETKKIIKENVHKLKSIEELIDYKKYEVCGDPQYDKQLLKNLGEKLEKFGRKKKMNKILDLLSLLDDYNLNQMNKKIKTILMNKIDDKIDMEVNEKTKKETKELIKQRNDLIKKSNERRKTSIENKDKKIKGNISAERMQYYNIIFDEDKQMYI